MRWNAERSAFTLVELLVVIAIISVLAALLLPTLDMAVEQSRRIACAGNQKQNYLALNLYAGDFGDQLPMRDTGNADQRILIRLALANGSIRHWFRDYANVTSWQGNAMALYAVPSNAESFVYCPSTNHDVYQPSYTMQGLGIFGYGWAQYLIGGHFNKVGTTRMTRLGEGSPQTLVGKFPYQVLGEYESNHNVAGGNFTIASGSTTWIDWEENRVLSNGIGWSNTGYCTRGMAVQIGNYNGISLSVNGYYYPSKIWSSSISNMITPEEPYQGIIFRSMGYSWPPRGVVTTAPTGY